MSETMPVKKESGRICVTRKDDVPVVVISPARNKKRRNCEYHGSTAISEITLFCK